MTLVHARALLSIQELLFSLSSSSWNLKLSNLYAGKRGRLDLDLLNSPIWQVNRNRVKSVIAGPQQSLPPTRDWPHPGFYVRYAFRKVVRVLYVPFQLLRKDEGAKTNGLTSPLNDAIIITASIIYYPPHNTHTHTPSPPLLHRRSFNWVNRTAVKIRSPPKLSFSWLIWKRWSSVIRSRIFYSSLSYHQIHPWWKTSWDQAWECTLLIWRVRVNLNTWP